MIENQKKTPCENTSQGVLAIVNKIIAIESHINFIIKYLKRNEKS